MRRIVSAAVGALALALAGAAPVAHADEDTIYAESQWLALDSGPGPWSPIVPQTPSLTSEIVDASTADATWAAGNPASAIGTSIETSNLDHEVEAGTEISVGYELRDGASAASGSVRLFAYLTDGGSPGNRPATAPDAVAVAPADATSGTLTATIAAGTVGYVGLTYDTSNGGVPGTVRFSNLTVDGKPVSFTAKPKPAPEEPTVTQPTCDCATGTITIPQSEHYVYHLEGQPVSGGAHEVEPGEYVVDAYAEWSADGPSMTWTLTVNEPPSEDECNPGTDDGTEDGTEDGTDDGAEDGTDDGTEQGSEDGDATGDDAGTEDGSETGSDDGTDGGTPTDEPTPTPSPTDDGNDDDGVGNDAGGDGELPDTGSLAGGPWMVAGGSALALVGALVLVLLRRRMGAQGGNL